MLDSLIGIIGTNRFGNFDSQQMHNTFLKFRVFDENQEFNLSNTTEWVSNIIAKISIGFPKEYLVRYFKCWFN